MKKKGVIAAMAGAILLAASAVGAQAPATAPAPNTTGSFMDIAIPAWAAFGAAVIPLLAVVITNLFNNSRLRKQFEYERSIRNDDRAADLRTEIYLAAAEALQAGITSIVKLGNLDVPYDEVVKDYVEKGPVLAKIQIVASEKVLRAVTNIMDEIGALHLKGAVERMSLDAFKINSAQQGEHISTLGVQRDQLLTLIQQYDPVESGGMERREELSKRFEETQDRIGEILAAKSKTDSEFFSGVVTLVEKCITDFSRVSKLAVPANVAVRAELGLPIDGDALSKILHDSVEKLEAESAQLTEHLRSIIAEMETGEAEGG